MSTVLRGPTSLSCLLAAALLLSAGCKDKKPETAAPEPSAPAAPEAAPAAAPSPPAEPTAAAPAEAAPAAAPAEPAAAAPEVNIGKSEELRFVEATSQILCFEREKKRQPKDKERAAILAEHGFKGKAGEEAYTQLNLRGDRDKEWGKRILDKIKFEMDERCPLKKK
ncbi:MAG: hypothetical protein AB2A00_07905 [Myxococcota bacterium]